MPCREEGFSLLMVMLFIGLGFLLMTGVLNYSSANSTATDRYNEYYTTLAASEAATEKIVGNIAHYFQNFGVAGVDNQLTNFGNMYPTAAELLGVGWQDEWGSYDFMNPVGGNNSTYVAKLSNEQYTGLNWKYSGFSGYAASYRIISNTRRATSGKNIVAALRQDVQVASIPLFEFGVFYALDMEVCPSQDMTFTGRVHCNTNIYSAPSNPKIVTFAGDVTSAHKILRQTDPDDPLTRTPPFAVNFLGAQDWNVASLKLPIGSTSAPNTLAQNTPAVLREIINIPPSPDETTLLGKQRYYNKADVIILVTNGGLVGKSGVNYPAVNLTSIVTNFVKVSTNTFQNKRESAATAGILFTEVDIQAFTNRYIDLRNALGADPKILYVADLRSQAGTQSGVRIVKGQTLPDAGLTVATPNPLYVKGHYNAFDLTAGSTNTFQTKPASLVADAVTVLSGDWNDTNSNSALSSRQPSDTTINAAIIAGIVPSNGTYYSGGVENFIRLLEDWNPTARTLTFNGSLVTLFESQIATGPWGGSGVYSPPIRRYGFDGNFKNATKLPPGTPHLRTLIRGEWAITQANSSL